MEGQIQIHLSHYASYPTEILPGHTHGMDPAAWLR